MTYCLEVPEQLIYFLGGAIGCAMGLIFNNRKGRKK